MVWGIIMSKQRGYGHHNNNVFGDMVIVMVIIMYVGAGFMVWGEIMWLGIMVREAILMVRG